MSLQEFKYPNGFRVIYEKPLNKIPVTGAYVFCDMGSVYEYDTMRGASHFIEHMCFKGTKRIPNSNDIFSEYTKIGSFFNAMTTKRYTCYTVKCLDEYLEKSISILSDMLMNSTFKKNEYEKEHNVVIEENNNDKNNPHFILNNEVDRIIFKGSSYEHPVDELEYHTDKKLLYKEVVNFYRTYYHPSNMILSVVSHLPFENIKAIIDNTFFIKSKKLSIPCVIPSLRYELEQYNETQYKLLLKKGLTNILLTIGFRTCPRSSRDKFILMLLSVIMGGNFSSRLMKLLREIRGLVYTAKCETKNYENSGSFVFFTETKPSNLFSVGKRKGVLPILINIIKTMKKHGVTETEVKNAKGNIKGNSVLNLENTGSQTKYNGEELLMVGHVKDIIPSSQIYERLFSGITKKDVDSVIEKYFTPENMCLCIISGSLLNLEKIKMECNVL